MELLDRGFGAYRADALVEDVVLQYLLRAIMIPTWLFLSAVFRPFRTVFPGLGAGFLNLGAKKERRNIGGR